LALVHILQL